MDDRWRSHCGRLIEGAIWLAVSFTGVRVFEAMASSFNITFLDMSNSLLRNRVSKNLNVAIIFFDKAFPCTMQLLWCINSI